MVTHALGRRGRSTIYNFDGEGLKETVHAHHFAYLNVRSATQRHTQARPPYIYDSRLTPKPQGATATGFRSGLKSAS